MAELIEWLTHNAKERQRLYEKFGKPLEPEHDGKFLAIGFEGQTILGNDDGEVLRKAIADLGSGNFVLTRVGRLTFGKWLKLSK